ncbi:MAG: hypothetical protein A3C06_03940 [Candidatus Taylorbacteria bacterium RIFCSPHIGHO2_02_FULL_46_13]|uniref:Uncharacterized protein n=1 Tax=Candidatus Taylorbacteria bacterium RIFCSPHIGHO2_02_FULL_46_13 TaxID=1802312 RepID=A0A1G2MQK8_9BACT|nr:MAG: hypothetical protein A3C06_03940 [Candidatus Taylorbacteria bacterium RIFCSPHIGHO2_02_FULL_46_13]
MRIYRNIFDNIISLENLFSAWDEFKKGKWARPDVEVFERDLEPNLFTLHRELRNGTYRHGPYTGFFITDPKRRHVHKATVRDRVLHHAVFSVLNPIFEPTFIQNSFSCRIGKGNHKGVDVVSSMLRKESGNDRVACYVLKCDIWKFFDSIDHEVLISILSKRIQDEKTLQLLKELIKSYEMGAECERE